jgi:hypothetical protein
MLVQPKGNTAAKERFHVPSGIGKALLATGVIEEYVAPAKPFEAVRWTVNPGALQGQYPPIVRAHCPNCNRNEYTESNKGTADQMIFLHCKGRETCPPEVRGEYQSLWRRWQEEFQPKE